MNVLDHFHMHEWQKRIMMTLCSPSSLNLQFDLLDYIPSHKTDGTDDFEDEIE